MNFPEKKTASVYWSFLQATIPSNGHLSSDFFGTTNTKFHLEVCNSDSPKKLHFTLHLDTNNGKMITFESSFRYQADSKWKTIQVNGDVSHKKSCLFPEYFQTIDEYFHVRFKMTFEEHEKLITKSKHPIDHPKALLDRLSALRLDSTSADITLISTLDGKEFPAHKFILSLRSPVFAAMFTHGDLRENQKNKVEINDVSGEVMETMLKYIYSGDVQEIEEIAGHLLVAADKYDIPLLVQECIQSMANNLSASNAAYFFYLAHLHQLEELKTEIGQFISKNRAAVRQSDGYKKFIKPDRDLVELFMDLLI